MVDSIFQGFAPMIAKMKKWC